MTSSWFKKLKWLYIPQGWYGWGVCLTILFINLRIFMRIDSALHSVSDTLYGFLPYLVGSLVVYYLIAVKTTK